MIGGNWQHVQDRLERVPDQDLHTLRKALSGLSKRIKARHMPMRDWYRTVVDGKRVIGHICGQGCYVSTIYRAEWQPRGERI